MNLSSVSLARLSTDAPLPHRATGGSFGYDLATIRAERVAPHETTILPCGFKLARDLEHDERGGMAMLVFPRSSLPLKYGLILPNSPGLIDADYSEQIGVIVHNLRDEEVRLDAGTRIAQAVFVRVEFPALDVTDQSDESRTRGGFGSTGA